MGRPAPKVKSCLLYQLIFTRFYAIKAISWYAFVRTVHDPLPVAEGQTWTHKFLSFVQTVLFQIYFESNLLDSLWRSLVRDFLSVWLDCSLYIKMDGMRAPPKVKPKHSDCHKARPLIDIRQETNQTKNDMSDSFKINRWF